MWVYAKVPFALVPLSWLYCLGKMIGILQGWALILPFEKDASSYTNQAPCSCICGISSACSPELLHWGGIWCCYTKSHGITDFIWEEMHCLLGFQPRNDFLNHKEFSHVPLTATAWRKKWVGCAFHRDRAFSQATSLQLENKSRHRGIYRMCWQQLI